ncbi:hypothetical protein Mapa_007510 [Marchantia paleacea]|nr:hypothetical protein Mapa_007510 [Marchantia paleacea]
MAWTSNWMTRKIRMSYFLTAYQAKRTGHRLSLSSSTTPFSASVKNMRARRI